MAYHDTIMELGQILGIDMTGYEEDGAYFEISERSVFLRHEADRSAVTLIAPVDVLGEEVSAGLAGRMLQLNFALMRASGHALAWEDESQRFLCMKSLPLSGLDGSALEAELGAIATKAGALRELIEADADLSRINSNARAIIADGDHGLLVRA